MALESRAPRTHTRSVAVHLDPGWKRHVDPAWLPGWNPEPFEITGGTTEVVAIGRGPAVVLLPPLPGFKESWLACAAPLARRFRVVTYDLRSRFPGPPRWEPLLEDLERVLDRYADGPVAMVGHSLGGALAQRFALARPERGRALVLSSSFARVSTPGVDRRARFIEQPMVLASQRLLPRGLALALARRLAARGAWVYDLRCDERLLDFVRFCIRDVPIGVARNAVNLAFAHDTRATLAAIRCPTLLVTGECESAFVRESVAELGRLMPGAETRVSPGVGHLHPLSGCGWLVETLTEWLGKNLAA